MSEPMPKRGKLIQPALLIVIDLLMLEIAFLATYWFRFHAGFWPTPLGIPPLSLYLGASSVVLVVFFAIFYTTGMYTSGAGRSLEEDLTGLFKCVVLGCLLLLALAFFLKREAFSRSFFGMFFWSCFFFLAFGRVLARRLLRRILQRGLGTRRLLLVGNNPMRERIIRAAWGLPGLALEPVGWLRVGGAHPSPPAGGPEPAVTAAARSRATAARPLPREGAAEPQLELTLPAAEVDTGPEGLACLGGVADIKSVVQKHGIDLVVLTLPFDQLPLVRSIAADFADLNTDLQFVPDLLALHTSRMRLTEIAGIPFISVREVALSGADRIVKRSFDLVCCASALLFLSPLLGLLALLVKLSSPGPVFYRQARVGRDGREFQMLKFRSMRTDAEQKSGPVWTVENDPRITPLGRFLRRFSLDELPQIWNVLVGDMSLVGPRPERRVFVDKFRHEMPRYFERHRVRSGLTGWAQVHGLRGNTSIEERTLYDLHYVENWSLALDVKIILMTMRHVLRGENAY